jgi:hypothetical protein
MEEDEKENYFEIKIWGKSTIYNESEIVDMIYELLKNKAEFQFA